MNLKGQLPEGLRDKIIFIFKAYTDFWIISGFIAAFIASITWTAALTKFELSFAYPFMSLSFVLVFFLSIFIFQETLSWSKIIGLIFVILGVIITAQKF